MNNKKKDISFVKLIELILIIFGMCSIIVTSIIMSGISENKVFIKKTDSEIFYNQESKFDLVQLSPQSDKQNMGYLIKTKNGKIIVVDGGNKEDTDNFESYIKKVGGKVDYWFITHPHEDHIGVLKEICQNRKDIEIDKLFYTINDLNWYEKYTKEYDLQGTEDAEDFYNIILKSSIIKEKEEVKLNQIINIDNVNINVLAVKNPEITDKKYTINNSSMVLKFNVSKTSILFLADCGELEAEKLLKENNLNLKSDIVQIAHHGQNGACKELYEEIKPKICMWPTPNWLWDDNNNKYNTCETRKWIENLNVKQNIVAKDGDQEIYIN